MSVDKTKGRVPSTGNKGLKVHLAAVEKELFQIKRQINNLLARQQELQDKRNEIKFQMQQESAEILANADWDRTDYVWSKKLESTLKQTFKITTLRPYQLSTMNATLSGQDCILIMPTGGGKSLCFQLPAILSTGITLVVSPLVSLMEDQLMALHSLGIPAEMLNAHCTVQEANKIQKEMLEKNPHLKLLYVTPEKLAKSKRFMAKLGKMYQMENFARLAIDEVHCCSQWGHDFRPDYKFLGIMKRQFPKVPIIGLTATATSRIVNDVQKILNIPGSLVLKASFNRPNLIYEVHAKESSHEDNIGQIVQMIKIRFKQQSGIVYCISIKETETVADSLKKSGIKARSYHAMLDAETRSQVHQRWSKNEIQVVVATVAFGMGIDKPDVRFVIHHSLSKSMETFYQESGRAGRDDQLAHCILLYRFADMFRQSTMVFTEQTGLENLYGMVAYCIDPKRCRRSIIAEHFGERWESSDCNSKCDHCDATNISPKESSVESGKHRVLLELPTRKRKFVAGGGDAQQAKVLASPATKTEKTEALSKMTPKVKVERKETVADGTCKIKLKVTRGMKLKNEESVTDTKLDFNKWDGIPSSKEEKRTISDKNDIGDGTCDIKLNFSEWDSILSSEEQRRTIKKERTEVSE